MKIEGTLVEMGDLDGWGAPGLRVEVGEQIVEITGLTRDQIKSMPPAMFKRVVITLEMQA